MLLKRHCRQVSLSWVISFRRVSVRFSDHPHHTSRCCGRLSFLAWSPTYLTRASLALARLVELDSGEQSGNKPGESLRSIFTVWYRNTGASVEEKLEALDALRRQAPEVVWPVLLALVPDMPGRASLTSAPRWRAWGQDDERRVSNQEITNMISKIIDRLLADAPGDVDRVLALLDKGRQFNAPQWTLLQELLDTTADLHTDAALRVWRTLRHFIARQQDYPNAKWTLSSTALQPLEAIRDRLEPAHPVLRFQWLFGPKPALGLAYPEHDYNERQTVLQSKRFSAVQEILDTCGSSGVQDLLTTLEKPEFAYWVGLAAGDIPDTVLDALRYFARSWPSSRLALPSSAVSCKAGTSGRAGIGRSVSDFSGSRGLDSRGARSVAADAAIRGPDLATGRRPRSRG